MGLRDDLESYVVATHEAQWSRTEVDEVPDSDDLKKLSNDAAEFEATVLYADLAESTDLVNEYPDWFAAEVYKNYLYCASRLITSTGGTITAYDGDRVMGVYIGGSKNTSAVKCALKINSAVSTILRPALKAQYPTSSYYLRHKVGVDSSPLFVAQTGVRGEHDLVWVGRAANHAAKMAALSTVYATYISDDVYFSMNDSVRLGGPQKEEMWDDLGTEELGFRVFGSTWRRSF
jgi:class 3 adenylate cyclase